MHRSRPTILDLIIGLSFLAALSGIVYGQDTPTNVSVITKSPSYNTAILTADKSINTSDVNTKLMNTVFKQEIANSTGNCTACTRNLYNSVTVAVIEKDANNSALNETLNETAARSKAKSTKTNAISEQNEIVTCYSIQKANSLEANATSYSYLNTNKTAPTKESCINCSTVLNASVPINEPPCCTIIAPSSVCADSIGNTASVIYQDGATYEWEITNGTITSDTNLPQIVWAAGSYPTPVSLKVKVTKTKGTGTSTSVCVCANNITIPVFQNLGCVINVPSLNICESSMNKASVPFQVEAIYDWNVINGSITSGQGTNQINWVANKLSNESPSTATIKVVVGRAPESTFNVCTCSKSITIHINPNPNCTITAPSSVCKGSKNNKASVPDAGLGATYEWEISNGAITAGQGTREISWDAGLGPIPIVIKVNVANAYGCSCSAGA